MKLIQYLHIYCASKLNIKLLYVNVLNKSLQLVIDWFINEIAIQLIFIKKILF